MSSMIPRLPRDALSAAVAEMLRPRVERLGYLRHQHERLCLKLGFGEEWIRAVEALDPQRLKDAEPRVQTLTLAVLRRQGHTTSKELDDMVSAIGHEAAIAVLMLIGRYVAHALMVNSLQLEPPVPSPLT